MLDASGVERRRTAHDAMHLVSFFYQKFGQKRTVLARNAGNQSYFRHIILSFSVFLCMSFYVSWAKVRIFLQSCTMELFSGNLRKLPASCSNLSEISASLLQAAATRRKFPQASCKLQQVSGNLRWYYFHNSNVTAALSTSPPKGGFCFATFTLACKILGKRPRNARTMRPATASSNCEGCSISFFTTSYTSA